MVTAWAPDTLPRMRRGALGAATAALLVGPTVLAFFAGGYFDGARAVAAIVAWAIVGGLAIFGPLPFPSTTPGRLAVAGLAGLAAWSAVSLAWAPMAAPVIDGVQRELLYIGALLAAVTLLRDPRAARAAEPVLALGALVVIAYGLAGRLVPELIHLRGSLGAGARLEQPITYWNAEGLLAAIGLVLFVRVAGDPTRAPRLRVAAIAASAPLGMGIYLSYSRGAMAVTVLGLLVLLALAPTWEQLRAAVAGLAAGVIAAACSAAFPGVAALTGSASSKQTDGALMLGLLLGIMGIAAFVASRSVAGEGRAPARAGRLPWARVLPGLARAAALACVAGLVLGGLLENGDGRPPPNSASPRSSQLASVDSLRYDYWGVGLRGFADHPVRGIGVGGFRVLWRQERTVAAGATEVHSLPLEAALELGVPGLLLLGLFLGAVGVGARRAIRLRDPLSTGASAVCLMWLLHATIDWDWQVPAVTLPVIVLAGGLFAASERAGPGPPLSPETDAPPRREPAAVAA
jgi:O-Antigen ligase